MPSAGLSVACFVCTVLALLAAAVWWICFRSRNLPAAARAVSFSEAGGMISVSLGRFTRRHWGLRLVCISDTHGDHRKLVVPDGDVLISAGDFTQFGNEEHAIDFGEWLDEQPHKVKIVALGNHENNSAWNKRVAELLPQATVLRQSSFQLGENGPKFFGTDFFWRCAGSNPYFDQIPEDTDVLIAHNPAEGCADGGKGCTSLLAAVRRVQPALVVSGHVHFARGAAILEHKSLPGESGNERSTLLLNCANCGSGDQERQLVHQPVIVDI